MSSKVFCPIPDIKSNIELVSMEQIKKYAGVPHGMSLVALSMLDPNNKDLELTIELDSEMYLESFVEHIMGVWQKYEPITSFLRSYKNSDEYLSEFNEIKLSTNPVFPNSNDHFKNKKVIIDVEYSLDKQKNPEYKFKFYRWSENKPRILHLYIKADLDEKKDEFVFE